MLRPFDLWGQRGWHNQEVAGESQYGDNIRAVLGKISSEWTEVVTTAQLIPEPTNRYDRNAVQVKIGGAVVGYLPREDAAVHADTLSRLVAEGLLPQVSASVRGANVADYDYDRRGDLVGTTRFVGSVRLDLAQPHLLAPVNPPPNRRHVILPQGAAIQVTGEEEYLAVLASMPGEHGEAWIHVTLHKIVDQLARSTRTVVEVRVDGSPAGRLTPKMSGELLPVIRHFAERGVTVACRALVKGNRLKSDLVLYAARSGELPHEWLESPPVHGVVGSTLPDGNAHTPDAGQVKWRFNPPPGWPPTPEGWTPPPGWAPPPDFPAPPADWQWWLSDRT